MATMKAEIEVTNTPIRDTSKLKHKCMVKYNIHSFEIKLKEIPIGVKWEWDDNKKCLSFKS